MRADASRPAVLSSLLAALPVALLAALLAAPGARAQSTTDLARLAWVPYGDAGVLPPAGWQQMVQQSRDSNGFAGAAFTDGKLNVVIAFAGTNDPKDVLADLGMGPEMLTGLTSEITTALSGGCAAGKVKGGLLCYPACKAGYHDDGATLCYGPCPSGTTTAPGTCNFPFGAVGACPSGLSGLKPSCINSDSYSRGAGTTATVANTQRNAAVAKAIPGTAMTRAQLAAAEKLYTAALAAKRLGGKKPAKVVLTGHSLGGYLAQVLGSRHGKATVTFNAPGAASMAAANADKITNYIRKDDVVGTVGAHVGQVVHYPDVAVAASDPTFVVQNHKIDYIYRDLQAGMKPQ